jgi:hypothetical protein
MLCHRSKKSRQRSPDVGARFLARVGLDLWICFAPRSTLDEQEAVRLQAEDARFASREGAASLLASQPGAAPR